MFEMAKQPDQQNHTFRQQKNTFTAGLTAAVQCRSEANAQEDMGSRQYQEEVHYYLSFSPQSHLRRADEAAQHSEGRRRLVESGAACLHRKPAFGVKLTEQ